MKKTNLSYLVLGFIAGIAYLVACGGGTSSIADIIGRAIDISYSNTSSGLSAENVQDAIDEILLSTDAIAGTWQGILYSQGKADYKPEDFESYRQATSDVEFSFDADGSFSCSGDLSKTNAFILHNGSSTICEGPGYAEDESRTWEIFGNTVLIKYTYSATDPSGTQTPTYYYAIQAKIVSGEMVLFFNGRQGDHAFFFGTKEE